MRTFIVAVTASSAIALAASTASPLDAVEPLATTAATAVPGTETAEPTEPDPTDPAVPDEEPGEVEGGVEGGPLEGGPGEEPDDSGPSPRAGKKKPSAGVFYSNGDYVHESSTPPATASGHGWWYKKSGPGEKAKVTVQLQAYDAKAKKWKTVATGNKTVKPSKKLRSAPSTHRANARKVCKGSTTVKWRSVIDVDIIDVNDTPDKAVTTARSLTCGAF
ncbi:hypothetical protein [Streptomyces uncialis]|uniref:hypothetical protein n=1 Tax=Streptomyces uncialis TaxID=1048205 RepID=UPI00225A568F|nr:hypothetical protein [Streptomyces uncialis]MCX4661317.1 hypothetical protein [Streptomyces uncialis]